MNPPNDLGGAFEQLLLTSQALGDSETAWRLWQPWHKYAEQQDPRARAHFIALMNHPREDWREFGINLLSSHYVLASPELESLRQLVVADPSSSVRVAAAGAVAHQGKWPEPSLIRALVRDGSRVVSKVAFFGLFQLAGGSYRAYLAEQRKVDLGQYRPSLKHLKILLGEHDLLERLAELERLSIDLG